MACYSGKPQREQGFTLLELMVVVIIVAVLATIAYPMYQDQMRKTRRAQARADMMQTIQKLERYHSARNTYAGFAATEITSSQPSFYTIAFDAAPTDTTFALRATPTGPQASDRCADLTINHAGTKGQSGAGMSTQDCW